MDTVNPRQDPPFRDTLEWLSARRKICEIVFRGDNGGKAIIRDRIDYLYTRDGKACLRTGSGLEIGLDCLIEVDGEYLGGAGEWV